MKVPGTGTTRLKRVISLSNDHVNADKKLVHTIFQALVLVSGSKEVNTAGSRYCDSVGEWGNCHLVQTLLTLLSLIYLTPDYAEG